MTRLERECPTCRWPLIKGYAPLELVIDNTPVILENVPGWICRSCGEVYRDTDDVLTAKAIARLDLMGLYSNDLPAVVLLFAPTRGKVATPIPGKTVFQKELWYLSQEVVSRSFPKANFMPMQGGPWDPNLDNRLERMRKGSLVTDIRHSTPSDTSFSAYSLTAKGKEKVETIWNTLPQNIKEAATSVKSRLNGLTAKQAVDLVHKEFPKMWDKSRLERWGVTLSGQENP